MNPFASEERVGLLSCLLNGSESFRKADCGFSKRWVWYRSELKLRPAYRLMESTIHGIDRSCGNPTAAKSDRLENQIGGNFVGGASHQWAWSGNRG